MESEAIIEFLEELSPYPPLLPADIVLRAKVSRLVSQGLPLSLDSASLARNPKIVLFTLLEMS